MSTTTYLTRLEPDVGIIRIAIRELVIGRRVLKRVSVLHEFRRRREEFILESRADLPRPK